MIILHRLPILPIWQALLAARLLSTLPPSWASWCQIKVFSRLKQIPLCSEGAPPGANGHPVPITYEGFTLLTDNNNNYFMSSFIPQVKTDWKLKVWSCLFISVQLLPDARLPDQPVPTEASVWLAASWQAFLEVSATHQLAHSTHPSSSILDYICIFIFSSTALPGDATIWGAEVGEYLILRAFWEIFERCAKMLTIHISIVLEIIASPQESRDKDKPTVQVAGRVWGAGAGPAPSGYGVERINGRCLTKQTLGKFNKFFVVTKLKIQRWLGHLCRHNGRLSSCCPHRGTQVFLFFN